MKKVNSPPYGAIAQLGERIVRNDEVVGSIPTSSTIFFRREGFSPIPCCVVDCVVTLVPHPELGRPTPG
jgi:hypothetical protein